eukprot:7427079-Pyramimonas_sp.AAC.1
MSEKNTARRSTRRQRPLRCSACPKEADGRGREFTDVGHLTADQIKHHYQTGAGHRPVKCRDCDAHHKRSRAFRRSACPTEADGRGREFTDRTHLTDKQVKHFFAKGSDHRSVVRRACHDQRKEAKKFECSACPRKKDASKPTFTDGGHLSKYQKKKKKYFHRGNLAVCAKCYKAGRAPRREPPKRPAEA